MNMKRAFIIYSCNSHVSISKFYSCILIRILNKNFDIILLNSKRKIQIKGKNVNESFFFMTSVVSSKEGLEGGAIAGIVIAVIVILVIVVVVVVVCARRRGTSPNTKYPER